MNRKWRTNRGALDSVQPYPAFRASIPPRDAAAPYTLADPSDLYAVYTVLHIERKAAELRWSPQGGFYYFLVQWEVAAGAQAAPQAPEGDEDPPPQIIPEGSEAALQLEALQLLQEQQRQQQRPTKKQRQQQGGGSQQEQPAEQQPAEQQPTEGQQAEQRQQQEQGQQPAEGQAPPADGEQAGQQQPRQGEQQGAAPPAAAGTQQQQPATVLRTQIVVPVSSGYRQLTPELLQRFFSVRGVQAQQLLLALVDSNGVVTRSCLYNYIQAPLEGPGTANLELLDD